MWRGLFELDASNGGRDAPVASTAPDGNADDEVQWFRRRDFVESTDNGCRKWNLALRAPKYNDRTVPYKSL